MTASILKHDSAPRILELWSELYWTYGRPFTPNAETWNPATALINAALVTELSAREVLDSVLDDSSRAFSPLSDPLKIDFGTHRWLSSSREEAYSDWLAWILGQISNRQQLLRLFGIQDVFTPTHPLPTPMIEREIPILDRVRRLDLVVRFGNHLELVVEVKTKPFDQHEVQSQLADYAAWASNRTIPTRCFFLAVEATGLECPAAFEILPWRELSLRIRALAQQWILNSEQGLGGSTNLVRAAMALAFCGAIERNLLALTPDSVALGQQLQIKDYAGVCFYLQFSRKEDGTPSVVPTISFWRSRQNVLSTLWESVNSRIPEDPEDKIGISKYAFWLTTTRQCVEWQLCMEAFDEVVEGWIEFWKHIGSPRQFLNS